MRPRAVPGLLRLWRDNEDISFPARDSGATDGIMRAVHFPHPTRQGAVPCVLALLFAAGCPDVPTATLAACGKQVCDVNAGCLTNRAGVSICICSPGYAGDGTTCVAIDEDAGPADAAIDGGPGLVADGGTDAGGDAGSRPGDAGPGADGGSDSGVPDAGDGGSDSGFAAGVDGGLDSGFLDTADGGHDSGGPDAADSGLADGGAPDAGTPDSGAPDSGTVPADGGAISSSYQIDPAHTGTVSDPSITLPLQVRWSATLHGQPAFPVIALGLVFVTTVTGYAGSGTLQALDVMTGSVVWGPLQTGGTHWSHIGYDDGRIFLLNDDGILAAYNAFSGAQAWLQVVPNEYIFVTGIPVARDGLVVITNDLSGRGDIAAFNETTGAPVWYSGGYGSDNTSSPAIGGGMIFATYICGEIWGGSEGNGLQAWVTSSNCSGGGQGAIPTLAGGRLYALRASETYQNVIVDPMRGTMLGTFPGESSPAFWKNTGYAVDGTTLESFSAATGQVGWMFTGDSEWTTPSIVVNGIVFAGTYLGTLFAVDGMTGMQRWSGATNSEIGIEDTQNMVVGGLAAGQGVVVTVGATTNPAENLLTVFAAAPDGGTPTDAGTPDAGAAAQDGGH